MNFFVVAGFGFDDHAADGACDGEGFGWRGDARDLAVADVVEEGGCGGDVFRQDNAGEGLKVFAGGAEGIDDDFFSVCCGDEERAGGVFLSEVAA